MLTVDCWDTNPATGMIEYECPDCGRERSITRDRWDTAPTLRCLLCGSTYHIPKGPTPPASA